MWLHKHGCLMQSYMGVVPCNSLQVYVGLTALMQPRCSTQAESFTVCFVAHFDTVEAQLYASLHGNSICVLHKYMQLKLP